MFILSQSWQRQPSSSANRLRRKEEGLVAIARAHRDTLAALGAPPRQYRSTALGLHAGAEAVRLRTATAIRLKCALRHGKIWLLISSNSSLARRLTSSLLWDAQSRSSAAQLLEILIFAASSEYIPSLRRPQKWQCARNLHHHLCNFRAQKIFSSQVASLRLRLCYYRQRSLKIFSTPCGCRKKLDRRSDA
jgi:hypothetical protein